MNDDFRNAHKYFKHNLYGEESIDSIVCEIFEIFYNEDEPHHNCLGCNLNQSLGLIDLFFNRIGTYKRYDEIYTDYILRLYLFVEKSFELFKIISLPQDYRTKHFVGFNKLHKWANFIKHPKAFLFSHHPEYNCEANPEEFEFVIDTDTVNRYYGGNKRNSVLYKKLENKHKVLVNFPSAHKLMIEFSDDVKKLVPLIRDNAIYTEILGEQATYENYFLLDDEQES